MQRAPNLPQLHGSTSKGRCGSTSSAEIAEDAQPGKAYTMTRVLFKYSFHVRGRAGQHEARLTAIKVYSVFLPEASWWAAKEDEWLLDHEQGHLDIAEIAARRLQLTFNRRFKAKRWISATGKTSDKGERSVGGEDCKNHGGRKRTGAGGKQGIRCEHIARPLG